MGTLRDILTDLFTESKKEKQSGLSSGRDKK
jgi:hypothetical protein